MLNALIIILAALLSFGTGLVLGYFMQNTLYENGLIDINLQNNKRLHLWKSVFNENDLCIEFTDKYSPKSFVVLDESGHITYLRDKYAKFIRKG